jgi:hypothetical protein
MQAALFMIGSIALVLFTMRYMTRYFIREALAAEGFETEAVATEFGTETILTAKNAYGQTVVSQTKKRPENLTVKIKQAVIPVSWDEYHWMELADGRRLSARPI